MTIRVIIAASRNRTRPEAVAVGAALAGRRCRVKYLDARLEVCDLIGATELPEADGVARHDSKTRWIDRIKAILNLLSVTRALALLRGIWIDRIRLRRVLAVEAPDAVVIFDDRRARPDLVLGRLAADCNALVIIVPFAVSSVESDIFMRRGKNAHALELAPWKWLKRWIAHRWPDQICVDEVDGPLLFFEPWDTLVLAACGILPNRPWVLGGSNPDIICGLGPDHRDYLTAGGVCPARVVVTGQPSLDRAAMSNEAVAELKSLLRARFALGGADPIVICAVPQHAEHGMMTWQQHWLATDELFAALAGSGMAVLLSLHPKSDRRNYAERAASYRLPIVDERMIEILPAADLLVATFSTTVRWAVGLGIPAFVVDSVGSKFQLYRDLAGVTVVNDHDALGREVDRFVHDTAYRERIARAARDGAARVGHVDGRARERVAGAITQAVAARKQREVATSTVSTTHREVV